MTAAARGWGSAPTARAQIMTVTCRSSGVKLPVHRAVAELVCALADATEERGYPLVTGWCWGYAPRRIRGSQSWSNHAWGLACFVGGTRLVTRDGVVPIEDVAGTEVELLTRNPFSGKAGRWLRAPVRSFGQQRIQRVTVSGRGFAAAVHATPGHRWFAYRGTATLRSGGPGQWRRARRVVELTTADLRPGDRLVPCHAPPHAEPLTELPARLDLRVDGVDVPGEAAEVFCAIVEETGAFTLEHGVLTGNCDLNAPRNPMGSRLVTDMPEWMVEMWEACGFRWGGRFTRRPDAMHYEYMGSPGDVAGHLRLAQSFAGQGAAVPAPQPTPEPTPEKLSHGEEEDDMILVRSTENGGVWLLTGGMRMRVSTRVELEAWAEAGARHLVSEGEIDGFPVPEQALAQWPWPEPSARPFGPEPVDL